MFSLNLKAFAIVTVVVLVNGVASTDMILGELRRKSRKNNSTHLENHEEKDSNGGLSRNEIFGIVISIILLMLCLAVYAINMYSKRKPELVETAGTTIGIQQLRNKNNATNKRRESSRVFIHEAEPPCYAVAIQLDIPNSGNNLWI